MPGFVDRPPDLVDELRSLRSRVYELEQRVRSAAFLAPVIARVTVGTTSIPNTATTTISFSTMTTDTAGCWNGGQPDRLTATRAGVYVVAGFAQFFDNSTGDRQATVVATSAGGGLMTIPAPTAAAQLTPTSIIECDEGDIVQLTVWQSSGGALNLTFGALAIAWVGVGS